MSDEGEEGDLIAALSSAVRQKHQASDIQAAADTILKEFGGMPGLINSAKLCFEFAQGQTKAAMMRLFMELVVKAAESRKERDATESLSDEELEAAARRLAGSKKAAFKLSDEEKAKYTQEPFVARE